jgi:hypothetical protein
LLVFVLLAACEGNSPEAGDLGSFFAVEAAGADVGADVPGEDGRGPGACFTGEPAKEDLSVAGQMFEMSFENLFPGDYVGNVDVKVVDLCGTVVRQFEVGASGSFAFHLPVGEQGFDAYFEFPHKPDAMPAAEYRFADYPLYREFDKPFRGTYIHCNLRIFSPQVISIPLTMLKQAPDLGYVQGTLYEWVTYDTIAGAVIAPSSGQTTYISDAAHLPDQTLTKTQGKGLFIVANVTPGEVVLAVTLPTGNVVEKTVTVWPLNSHPNKMITNVGVPVMDELL